VKKYVEESLDKNLPRFLEKQKFAMHYVIPSENFSTNFFY